MSQDPHPALLGIEDDSTYCQIASQDIAIRTCLLHQGQDGCFGCASPARLCEDCHQQVVDVPAVGMCSECLTIALKKELTVKKTHLDPDTRVDCQLYGKKIKVDMCAASQGQEGCRDCQAPSRLCETCHDRPVRFHQYGLCLSCSVDEFGEDWQPIDISSIKRDPLPKSLATTQDKDSSTAETDRLDALLGPAKALLWVHGNGSASMFQELLGINIYHASCLAHRLEQEGILGSHAQRYGKRPLRVPKEKLLEDPRTQAIVSAMALSTQHKIKELEKVILIIGEESKLSAVLRAVILDLQNAERIKKSLRKIKEEP